MGGNPLNLTIENRMAALPDVERTWMWKVYIPDISTLTDGEANIEDILLRCRSVDIPQRSMAAITSNWMGMKQFFTGRPELGGTVAMQFEETDDMKIRTLFWKWEEKLYNTEFKGVNGGKASAPLKRILSKDIYLGLYTTNNAPLRSAIKFHNAWPQTSSSVSLNYDNSDSVKYTITFQYDFWSLVPGVPGT